jgi:putative tricarboxylic transport membrane protein
MLDSGGSVWIMWSNPLVGSITTLALVMLVWPFVTKLLARFRTPTARAGAGA